MAYSDLSPKTEKTRLSDDTDLRLITDVIGKPDTAAATTDAGTWSLIALVKRLLEKWTAGVTISGSLPAGTALIGKTNPVTSASAQITGATGAAAPAGGMLVGGTNGTNLTAHYMRTSLAGSINPQAALETAAYLMAQNADGTYSRVPNAYSDAFTSGVLATQGMGWDGTNHQRVRVANVHKNAQNGALATAGLITAWTPAAGKKFRILGLLICVSISGSYSLTQRDSGGTVETKRVVELLLSANVPFVMELPTNGYLSTVANDILRIANNTGSTAAVNVAVFGTEE